MKKSVFFGTLVAAGALAGIASADTLADAAAKAVAAQAKRAA